VHVLRLVPA